MGVPGLLNRRGHPYAVPPGGDQQHMGGNKKLRIEVVVYGFECS